MIPGITASENRGASVGNTVSKILMDFIAGTYTVNGLSVDVGDLLGGGFIPGSIGDAGMSAGEEDVPINYPRAIGALFTSIRAGHLNGCTIVAEWQLKANPPAASDNGGQILHCFFGADPNTADEVAVQASNSSGVSVYDDYDAFAQASNNWHTSNGSVQKIAVTISRDTGSGREYAVSANGQTAVTDTVAYAQSVPVESVHLFGVEDWGVAVDEWFIRKFQVLAPVLPADLPALSEVEAYPSGEPETGGSLSFLCHFDGVDGATAAVDVSVNAHPITFLGNAQLDTAQAKFGVSSVKFDGTGDALSIANHASLLFGAGAFTIDWFFRMAVENNFSLMGVFDEPSNLSWEIDHLFNFPSAGNNFLNFTPSTDGATGSGVGGVAEIGTGSFHHAYVSRNRQGMLRVGCNGVVIYNGFNVDDFFAAAAPLMIGARNDLTNPFNGWIDRVEIWKGADLYNQSTTYSDRFSPTWSSPSTFQVVEGVQLRYPLLTSEPCSFTLSGNDAQFLETWSFDGTLHYLRFLNDTVHDYDSPPATTTSRHFVPTLIPQSLVTGLLGPPLSPDIELTNITNKPDKPTLAAGTPTQTTIPLIIGWPTNVPLTLKEFEIGTGSGYEPFTSEDTLVGLTAGTSYANIRVRCTSDQGDISDPSDPITVSTATIPVEEEVSNIDASTLTKIGDMTGGNGLASLFDGNTNRASAQAAQLNNTTSSYAGIILATAAIIEGATVYGSNDLGYVQNDNTTSVTLNLRVKATAPANAADGTLLATTTFTDYANASDGKVLTSTDQVTSRAAGSYVWVEMTTPTAKGHRRVEVVFRKRVTPAGSTGVSAIPANSFWQMIGIQSHLDWDSGNSTNWNFSGWRTLMAPFAKTRSSMGVGAKGTIARAHLTALYNQGGMRISVVMKQMTSSGTVNQGAVNAALDELIPHAAKIYQFEGPNEFNHEHPGADWPARLFGFDTYLAAQVRNRAAFDAVDLCTSSIWEMRDADYNSMAGAGNRYALGYRLRNMHYYNGSRNFTIFNSNQDGGYVPGSIDLAFQENSVILPQSNRVSVTETGMQMATALHIPVAGSQAATTDRIHPDAVSEYAGRMLAEFFWRGDVELANYYVLFGTPDNFGLCTVSGTTVNPRVPYYTVRNLAQKTKDPGASWTSGAGWVYTPYTPRSVDYAFTGGTELSPGRGRIGADVKYVMLDKRSGKVIFMLWRDTSRYNNSTRQLTTIAPVNVVLDVTGNGFTTCNVYRPTVLLGENADTKRDTAVATKSPASPMTIPVRGDVVFVELT